MAFWTTETFRERFATEDIVEPSDLSRIKQGCYQLSVGREVCITDQQDETQKTILENEDSTAVIPPGQFALLMTDEVVAVPRDAIGFISIRFSYKSKGLINVSGFHVDPGFKGRLKFSVYNAGSQSVALQRGDQAFMMWLANLDQKTEDAYQGDHQGQDGISSSDVERMQGVLYSPASLIDRIKDLEKQTDVRMRALESRMSIATIIFRILVMSLVIPFLWLVLRPAIEKWIAAEPCPADANQVESAEIANPTPMVDDEFDPNDEVLPEGEKN